ncbi:hypothetical protein AGMMS49992_12660 [Clostridia bacterium]|nr:hypothetical protein AGMMS49992_12660 [Clostridia bacterium]
MMKKENWLQRALHDVRRSFGLYLLIILPLAYLVIFKYIPIYGVQIAFRNYSPVRSVANSPWVGMKYVTRFLTNYQFTRILKNTLLISLYSLATFPLPIVFALMLNHMPLRRFVKTV